jgi:hypothetical protein
VFGGVLVTKAYSNGRRIDQNGYQIGTVDDRNLLQRKLQTCAPFFGAPLKHVPQRPKHMKRERKSKKERAHVGAWELGDVAGVVGL